jgi:hypothetical protein
MATDSSGDDPRQLLSSAHELTERVRRAQRATWFPLLVFAAVIFVAIPFTRYGGHFPAKCTLVHTADQGTLRQCVAYGTVGVYWPIALVLAYAAIAVFYVRRSRARGVGTRVMPYVITGIVVAALGAGVSIWVLRDPSILGTGALRLTRPVALIGVALLVLAWAERNRALLGLTLVYLAIVLIPTALGVSTHGSTRWGFLPFLLIPGCVLLLGGIGFAWAQRPDRLDTA